MRSNRSNCRKKGQLRQDCTSPHSPSRPMISEYRFRRFDTNHDVDGCEGPFSWIAQRVLARSGLLGWVLTLECGWSSKAHNSVGTARGISRHQRRRPGERGPAQTRRKRPGNSARRAEERGRRQALHGPTAWIALIRALPQGRTPRGAKELVEQRVSGNLVVNRQPTWGMSA